MAMAKAVSTGVAERGTRTSESSFLRFGSLAGILLALTSWATVIVYYAVVPAAQRAPVTNVSAYLASLAQDSGGTQLYNGLYALIAAWAFIGTIAIYFRLRAFNETWVFFATVLAGVAAVLTILNALQQLAMARYLAGLYSTNKDLAMAVYGLPAPLNPVNAVTAGLTAPWFLIVSIVMLKTNLPRLLAYLGLVAFADLTVGFLATLFGLDPLPIITAVIAGAVGGPLFWLWLGLLLRRDASA